MILAQINCEKEKEKKRTRWKSLIPKTYEALVFERKGVYLIKYKKFMMLGVMFFTQNKRSKFLQKKSSVKVFDA